MLRPFKKPNMTAITATSICNPDAVVVGNEEPTSPPLRNVGHGNNSDRRIRNPLCERQCRGGSLTFPRFDVQAPAEVLAQS